MIDRKSYKYTVGEMIERLKQYDPESKFKLGLYEQDSWVHIEEVVVEVCSTRGTHEKCADCELARSDVILRTWER